MGQERYKGRTAVVTGAAGNIGKSIIEALVKEGAVVGALDVATDSLIESYADIKQVFPIFCDVTNRTSVERAVATAIEHLGRIDVLFCVVTVTGKKSLLELTEEEWKRVMDVNLNGTFFINQSILKQMNEEKQKGRIVNICAIPPAVPKEYQGLFFVGKGALAGLARESARGAIPRGISMHTVDGAHKTTKEIVEIVLLLGSEEENDEINGTNADQPSKTA